eukprot:scaffold181608_cov63-Attheya_sp.AAC.2
MFIAIGVAALCRASLSRSSLASMFVAGSAGSGYCLRSARVRGKMQVVARGLGFEVCWIAAAGMDRHVFAIVVGLAGGADIGGPGGQSFSCGEDPVSEVWPRETIPFVESS